MSTCTSNLITSNTLQKQKRRNQSDPTPGWKCSTTTPGCGVRALCDITNNRLSMSEDKVKNWTFFTCGKFPEGLARVVFTFYLKGLLKWRILHNNGFFFLGSEHLLTWRTSLQTQHSLLVKTKPDMERCYEQRTTVLPCRTKEEEKKSVCLADVIFKESDHK